MSFSKRMKLPILFSILLSIAACVQLPSARSLTLDRSRAALGETVVATLTGLPAASATVTVAGLAADATVDGAELRFVVPAGAPAGPQTVVVSAAGEALEAALTVLGADAVPGLAGVIVNASVSDLDLVTRLADIGFDVSGPQRPLGGAGACSGRLATVDVGGTPLGEALARLERLEADDPGTLFHIDPVSDYDFDRVDHLGALGAPAAHARGSGGAGTLIAIFDTGVNEHPELAGRVRYDLGVNALAPAAPPLDDFGAVGHGTPAAVLAAGALSGVAPEAEIVPAKVCDEDGICRSSELIVGLCAVLTSVEEAGRTDDTVLSLSLGGPTPIAALEAILAEALDRGVPVAAAAGNGGLDGSPTHYPAAHDLPGLLAVGALEADALACVTFEDQTVGSSFTSGKTMTADGVVLTVGDFDAGGTPTSGFTAIDDAGMAGGLGLDAEVNNVTLAFGFPYPLDGVSLVYGDYGGTINLGVDDELFVVGSMIALPMQSASGVAIEVTQARDESLGTLDLSGAIDAFALGGQELWIDEICPRATSGWAPADFSTRGPYVDLSAPGRDVRSGTPGGGYALYEGTSFSTPQGAAAQALWRQANPAATPASIEAALIGLARALPHPADAVGAGLIDLSVSP